jgi:hypothetical protein
MNHSRRAALIPTPTVVKDPSRGVNFLAPESALGSPWVANQLSIVATAGELIGAVDVTISGKSCINVGETLISMALSTLPQSGLLQTDAPIVI